MNNTDVRFEPPLARASMFRDAQTRLDADALAGELRNPRARFVALVGDEMLAHTPEKSAAVSATETRLLSMLTSSELRSLFGVSVDEHQSMFLGRTLAGGAPVFAVVLDADASKSDRESLRWIDIRAHIDALSDEETGIFTTALALAKWHSSAQFSPATGNATIPEQGGWMRRDTVSGREIYPRTDPAVIVLVTDDRDRVLLGSNLLWNKDRYSLLAGFVEAGESLEGAVHREIEEEAGIQVSDLRYVTSQPWPFPQSLMLGFTARLADGQNSEDIVPDASELAALKWFTRDELLSPDSPVKLPGSASIARYMIDNWLAQRGELARE